MDWTLEQMHEQEPFIDENDALLHRKMLGMILDRMVNQDTMLLLTPQGEDQEPLVMVHPNFVLEGETLHEA